MHTKCKNMVSKVVVLLLTMSIMLGGLPVMAQQLTTDETIDFNQYGSVTIFKYESDRGEADDIDPGIGTEPGEDPDLPIGETTMHDPLPDVTYTMYLIADLTQNHLDGTGTQVSLEYTSRLISVSGQTIEVPSGLSTTDELNQFVNDLRDSTDPNKRVSDACLATLPRWQGTTDENGRLQFGKDADGNNTLPLGIYVIYEEEHPSLVTDTQAAVFSLPTTAVADGSELEENGQDDVKEPQDPDDNLAGDPDNEGRVWVYDIIVHPKNQTKQISVEKHIIADTGADTTVQIDGTNDPSNDILTDTEDYEIGDTIRYWVQAEIPKNIGEMEFFYLTDRLSAGQTFTNDVAGENTVAKMEVWARDAETGAMVYIPVRNDYSELNYIVSDPTAAADESTADDDYYGNSQVITDDLCSTFNIYFNTQLLSQPSQDTTKRERKYSEIFVTFNVVLNENAIIGNPGNPNDVALNYSHTTTSNAEEIPDRPNVPGPNDEIDTINPQCVDTRVYTYALELTKLGEGQEDMSGTEFRLYDANRNPINVTAYADGRGYYVNKDDGTDILTVNDENELVIFGLDDGTYQLVETKALPGYNLLIEPIVFTITSDAATDALTYQYQEDPDGEYFQIEEGYGYYIVQKHPTTGREQKLAIDLTGHEVGEYVAVAEGKEVWSYVLNGDDGSMTNGARVVGTRYSYRWTDDETMTWESNYHTLENGTFDVTVYNRKGLEIPATGGIGVLPFVLGGGIVAAGGCSGLAMMIRRKKKNA